MLHARIGMARWLVRVHRPSWTRRRWSMHRDPIIPRLAIGSLSHFKVVPLHFVNLPDECVLAPLAVLLNASKQPCVVWPDAKEDSPVKVFQAQGLSPRLLLTDNCEGAQLRTNPSHVQYQTQEQLMEANDSASEAHIVLYSGAKRVLSGEPTKPGKTSIAGGPGRPRSIVRLSRPWF